jgi:hypothetical protein
MLRFAHKFPDRSGKHYSPPAIDKREKGADRAEPQQASRIELDVRSPIQFTDMEQM